MPLLLLDLDNTLIDRAAAFRRWAGEYVAALGAPATEVEWLVATDKDGFEARERVSAAIRERFGLASASETELLETLRRGLVEHITLDPAIPEALRAATVAGWTPVVVTNGTVHQQERKLRHTGLDREVAGWVISDGVGVRKPDPAIFAHAANQVGHDLVGAWIVGDADHADIEGAHNTGIRSVWLHRGRAWSRPEFVPTLTADNCAAAIDAVLKTSGW